MKRNIGIILAGGIGSRFGGAIPKQYCLIEGREMISYSIEAFRKAKNIDDFFVVLDEKAMKEGRISQMYGVKTIQGGSSRNGSFKNALEFVKHNYPDCEKIIENNAACPMITPELIDLFMDKLDEYDYVNTCYKITDALGAYKGRIANREDYYLIQAPDAYRFQLLYKHFDEHSELCHPAHQLPLEAKEYRYFDYLDNFKVTHPQDIEIVEILMKRRRAQNA